MNNDPIFPVNRMAFFQRKATVGTDAAEYARQRQQKTAHGLPPGIHWDGPQNVGSKTLLMFTDSESGDTFSVNPDKSDYANIMAAAVQCRATREQHKMMAASFGPVSSL